MSDRGSVVKKSEEIFQKVGSIFKSILHQLVSFIIERTAYCRTSFDNVVLYTSLYAGLYTVPLVPKFFHSSGLVTTCPLTRVDPLNNTQDKSDIMI